VSVETDPRLGTELAGYRIESVLGRGGMGVTYLAEDVRLGRRVALELLTTELAGDERFRERFLRESTLVASLDHPGIVPVYEAREAEGELYVAMAYVEGSDLASLLARERRLEPERALGIVSQLAEALDAARWGRGLVHGALSPSAVLVAAAAGTASGERVFLSGFGLRQELPPGAELAEAARQLGTVRYPAPEQIEGRPVSPRSDVYALGCLLFQCLTGRPPFKGDSPEVLLQAHLHEQPPSATRCCLGLPAGIDRVLARALAKWPEERYSTCTELAAAAQAALAAGGRQPGRAPVDERVSPVALPPGRERAPGEDLPPPGPTDGREVVAPDSFAQRLSTSRRKAVATIGLAVLLAALVAGVVWLAGRDTGAVSPATPAPRAAETPSEAAGGAGQGTAQPAETEPTAAPEDDSAAAEPPAEADAPAEPAGEGPPEPVLSRLPGSLVRIDAATGEILARLAIPSPKLLASDGRSVWVLSDEVASDKLVHVEAATNAVTEIFNADIAGVQPTEFAVPTQLAVAGGSAWLAVDLGLYRFARGASAGEPAEIETDSPWFQWPVAAADSLWVRNGEGGGAVLRVDPVRERVLARLPPIDQIVAAGAGFLWGLDGAAGPGGRLVRIDTETHETVPIGVLGFEWADFTVAGGAVWASSPLDEAIIRLDPVTGEEQERIGVGGAPGALAAGGGAVWVAISNGTVVRYDLAANRFDASRIKPIEVGGTPNDLVFGRGSVWVAVEWLTSEEYIARGYAICEAAQARLQEEIEELQARAPDDDKAFYELAARWTREVLAELRALPPPEPVRARFEHDYSWLERESEALRRAATTGELDLGAGPARRFVHASLQGCTAGG
jgi:hypothetical protein